MDAASFFFLFWFGVPSLICVPCLYDALCAICKPTWRKKPAERKTTPARLINLAADHLIRKDGEPQPFHSSAVLPFAPSFVPPSTESPLRSPSPSPSPMAGSSSSTTGPPPIHRNPLNEAELESRRSIARGKRAALNDDVISAYDTQQATIIALAEDHGISEARAGLLLGAKIIEDHNTRAPSAYNGFVSTMCESLNAGKSSPSPSLTLFLIATTSVLTIYVQVSRRANSSSTSTRSKRSSATSGAGSPWTNASSTGRSSSTLAPQSFPVQRSVPRELSETHLLAGLRPYTL